ncbi:MAG: phosphate transport system permease protein [bacterium]|jgi:phosphate transport system permease protein
MEQSQTVQSERPSNLNLRKVNAQSKPLNTDKYFRKSKLIDRIARWIITAGGIAVIFCVVGILVLILKEAIPLFFNAEIHKLSQFSISEKEKIVEFGVDDYLETGFTLNEKGQLNHIQIQDGKTIKVRHIQPVKNGATIQSIRSNQRNTFTILWSNQTVTLDQVKFFTKFSKEGKRSVDIKLNRVATFQGQKTGTPISARFNEGTTVAVSLNTKNRFVIQQSKVTENFLGEKEVVKTTLETKVIPSGKYTIYTLDSTGKTLYAATENGYISRWDLSELSEEGVQHLEETKAFTDNRKITALTLIFGDVSLAVGDEKGGVSTWFPVRKNGLDTNKKYLNQIHVLSSHKKPIQQLIASQRDKSIISISQNSVYLDHMTSEKELFKLDTKSPIQKISWNAKGNGLIALNQKGEFVVWDIRNPHPEISWKVLFGKVWYENYDTPTYVWQSSSGNDDFEAKLSLIPLLFGSLKGTFYAMIFAIPLALFSAVYVSQFASERSRKVVKPAIEIMASIPSVILGFLAALWLAPILEKGIVAFFLSLFIVPTLVLTFLFLWPMVSRTKFLQKMSSGFEYLIILPVILLSAYLSISLAPTIEASFFNGNFSLWLTDAIGVNYDQRNSIIIAFGLGFTVIPIIFTMSEDAISNVPANLKAASLALGATRWQTVWRVILPSASPGIFAAIIIGLGRAIGETMIVLMATGNTPIIDPSIFNGMRTLSANIAVEIPEAPVGGTLYRTLFLSAILLFSLIFVLNTTAELIRQRLRKKYGNL